ncbi:endogenous retrovirus group K member 7 Env polyprotein-like [Manis javanica]|uniref:endogenous retrovirus group K member 7 Env polyprotein-like n=1 Tax=Manis javanica TaxID=9974 RepID=UPI003C6D7DB0
MVLWINGTFVHSPRNNSTDRPRQPKYASHCVGDYEGELWPWTDCQSTVVTWATERQEFTISPDMEGRPANEAWWPVKVLEGEFRQQLSMNPFHKWMLCGVNGSCTNLSPFSALQGGGIGVKNITFWCENNHTRAHWNMTMTHNNENYTCSAKSGPESPNSLFPPSPVCVYPPFLFILSNSSFDSCSNETCFLSQCWDACNFTNALVVRIPRWVPVPVDAPNTMTLFRERRDFGVTAAIVLLISATAVAATAAGIALDTSIKSATELNNLATSVASALDQQSTLDGKLKGGIMILNQHIDLVEEQMEVLWQMAQLGCERKYRALCITSIQYENFTRAANLSRDLSQYLSGNWSQDFDGTLEELRREIIHINSTRLDISVAEGLSSWFLRALSHVKEWAGMAGMGVFLLGGLMLLLWLLCRLRNQHKQDKVILAQALMAIDVGASPQVWLNMLKKEAQL